MLRASLMGVVMGLMCGLVGPAQAQNGANCLERCRTNHCNGGATGMVGSPQCVNKCMAFCQSKDSKPK
jgi:hypothetical protein